MELSRKALKIIAAVTGISLFVMFFRLFSRFSYLIPLFLAEHEAAAIGVIGVVDGPTSIFVARKFSLPLALLFLCSLAEVILHIFLFVKSIKALRKGK